MNLLIAIIESDTAKHTAPTAVQMVGNRANSAADTMALSTTMYSVTGTVNFSLPRCGQNHVNNAADARHISTAAVMRPAEGDDFTARGTSAARKHRCANRNDPR